MEIYRRNPKGIMVVLPADHWVQEEGLFRRTIKAAIQIAHAQDNLITIGIRPTHPETGYGYISTNKQHMGPYGISISKVKSFKEKPDSEEAVRLIRRGALWNSGIFVWKAETILTILGRFAPRISRCLQKINESIGKGSLSSTHPKAGTALRSQYRKMPNVSIDHAVLEKAGARGIVFTLQANFRWSDVGTWASLYTLLSHDRRGNAAIGNWLGIDSRNCLIYSTDRLIVLLGMRNALVVDSPDALLVGDLKRAQDIREIVKRLSLKDIHRYLVN
jgi:mannose-1-phosphate guanylyltransferase